MKNLYILLFLLVLGSCSTLNRTQVNAVNQFGHTTQEFTAYLGKITDELADIRMQRGLYYASTLQNPQLHIAELDSIFSQKEYDYKVSKKVDITFKIIDKYAQSLILLTGDDPLNNIQESAGNFGVGLDSLVTLYNKYDDKKQLPSGIGNALNQLIISGSSQYIKHRQAKEIKKFIPQADTLVAVMTTNFLEYLESSTIEELIAHEERMIRRDYLTFLQHTEQNTFNSQKGYLDLKSSIKNIKILQTQTIEATINLRKTHRKLSQIIQQKNTIIEVIKELSNFQEQVLAIRNTIRKIETVKA